MGESKKLTENNHNRETKLGRLALCGALGIGGATFSATAANADIIYTDLTGSELVFTSTQSPGIDMDNDGTIDFTIDMGLFGPNVYGTSSNLLRLGAQSGAPVNNAVASNGLGFGGVKNLNAGESISARTFQRVGYLQQQYTAYFSSYLYGSFPNGQTGFVGVKFLDGTGNERVGWLELSVTGTVFNGAFNSVQAVVSRYAYARGSSIVAGQISAVPEPTALGLLALGAVGIVARRRKRAA